MTMTLRFSVAVIIAQKPLTTVDNYLRRVSGTYTKGNRVIGRKECRAVNGLYEYCVRVYDYYRYSMVVKQFTGLAKYYQYQ